MFKQVRKLRRTGKEPRTTRLVMTGAVVKKARKPLTIVDKVKKILRGQEETKYIAEYMLDSTTTGYVYFNSIIKTTPVTGTPGDNWYRCIPLLPLSPTVGQNSWTREGKEVAPSTLKCHWNFRFGTKDDYTRDIYVVLYVVQPVSAKQYSSQAINNQDIVEDNFLDTGDNSSAYFAGRAISYQLPADTDRVRILHKKRFHLFKASGLTNDVGVVGQYDGNGLGSYMATGKLSQTHTWTCPLPKKLKYDEKSTLPNVPVNAAPCWAVGYYYSDGSPADTLGGDLAVDFWAGMTYKDV